MIASEVLEALIRMDPTEDNRWGSYWGYEYYQNYLRGDFNVTWVSHYQCICCQRWTEGNGGTFIFGRGTTTEAGFHCVDCLWNCVFHRPLRNCPFLDWAHLFLHQRGEGKEIWQNLS